MCPSFFEVCNGCVVNYAIGFDACGPLITFGLSTIGLGNVGWIIGFCQAPIITVVLNLIEDEAKLNSALCPTMWKSNGIAQLFLFSNVFE